MKVLMVTTAFYPEQAIGSVRMSAIAKFTVAAGHDLSIISLTPQSWARKDESLYFPELDEIDWVQIPQSTFFYRAFGRSREMIIGNKPALTRVTAESNGWLSRVKGAVMRLTQFLYTLLKALDWSVVVLRHARGKADKKFDIAVVSYPSLASPLAGILLKKFGIVKTLHVDFRDPVVYGKAGLFSLPRLVQSYIIRHADLVTGISKGVTEKVCSKNRHRANCLIIPNGYDDELCIGAAGVRADRATLSFCYVGSMYGGRRDLSVIFESIGHAAGGVSRLPVSIHYAGNDWAIFRDQCLPYLPETSLVNHGFVSRNEALQLENEADVCLLATWNTTEDQGILTGKMFEFFMLRKPILAVVNGDLPESETKAVIEEVGAGFCFEEAQSEALDQLDKWIVAVMKEKRESGEVASRYNSGVEKYSFKSLVGELLEHQHVVVEEKC